MNKEDWVDYLNSKPNYIELVLTFCKHKGKSESDTIQYLQLITLGLLRNYGITLEGMARDVIDFICIEFDIIQLNNKNEQLIKFYLNQQTNGKEIYKV